jgi:hypothetical protein
LTKFPEKVVPHCKKVLERLSKCEKVKVHFTNEDLEPFPSFGLIDTEEIVLITQPQKNTEITTMWTNNQIIVHLVRNYFEDLWAHSSDVQTIIHEFPEE